jgi:hypothetical protein
VPASTPTDLCATRVREAKSSLFVTLVFDRAFGADNGRAMIAAAFPVLHPVCRSVLHFGDASPRDGDADERVPVLSCASGTCPGWYIVCRVPLSRTGMWYVVCHRVPCWYVAHVPMIRSGYLLRVPF